LDQARLRCAPPRRRGPRIALPWEARWRGRASDKGSSAQINQAPLAPRRAVRGFDPLLAGAMTRSFMSAPGLAATGLTRRAAGPDGREVVFTAVDVETTGLEDGDR